MSRGRERDRGMRTEAAELLQRRPKRNAAKLENQAAPLSAAAPIPHPCLFLL